MATKKSKASKASKPRRERRSVRRTYRKVREGSKGKIRWGEAILSAIVGWKGDVILDPVMTLANPYMPDNVRNALNDVGNPGGYGSYLAMGAGANKLLGTVSLAKVAYDVVKHKRLDEDDLSVYLPYTIGTVFDPVTKSSSHEEGWS